MEIYTEGDCRWFGLSSLQVSIGDETYAFGPLDSAALLPEGKTMDDSCNPDIVFNEDGSVTDDGDLFFKETLINTKISIPVTIISKFWGKYRYYPL